MVRGKNGLIGWQKGPDLVAIKEWRAAQSETGRPNSLKDYFWTYGICFDCLGHGAKMIGWSDPATPEDFQAAKELNLEQLPLYGVCPTCRGTGRAGTANEPGQV